MAKRSKVVVEATTVENIEASNVTAASSDSLAGDSLWERVKMANFKFAMRQFDNGSEQGSALSWRGLVCRLLSLKDSDKQVFITIFENNSERYNITLRMRVVLSDSGIGYSLCSLLEHLANKAPQGVFIRVDIRDTLEVSEVLNLLRERFPRPKPNNP